MNKIKFFVPVLVALGAALSFGGHAHAYSQPRLMDDQVFDNVNSLSTSQVADFLAARSGPFTKLSTASPCLSGYNDINFHWDNVKWHYGSDTDWNTAWGPAQIPAATVVAQAAQMWGINPEVLIATLQKEESLVTGTSCDGWRYNSAMGYGCPDSGGCNPKYAGLTKQVLWGAWQLKFNKERSYGNTSWDGDDVITYVGYMTQGIRKRCGTCTSIYYDGYASLDSQSVYLENGTTASLYTYTPHLGNSTPVNFEKWFGLAVLPNYVASYAGQSNYPTIVAGSSASAYLQYKNVGATAWYDDTSIGSAPPGNYPVHLATSHPLNRSSGFGSAWGGAQNRPSANFAAVYESDGTTLASNQHVAQPGQIVKFSFSLSVSANMAPGVYPEYFQPVAEGSPTGSFNDPGTFLNVTTQPQIYSSAFSGQSGYPSLTVGQQTNSYFSYKNTGNMAWYDDAGLSGAPAGTKPVHLATSHPLNRGSGFGGAWGGDNNRPVGSFTAVFESDGATLAANQHVAQPGQIVKFTFTLTGPNTIPSGTYREYFQPIMEGGSAMNDPGTFLDITLLPYTYSDSYFNQSNYPTISRGGTTSGYFLYKNTGSVAWYDITSALRGVHPTILATSRPINRSSVFSDSSWCNNVDKNRATCTFAAVYEADGTTLAPNQHIAQPGQIAKFSFNFTASSTQPVGTYREFFQPITEGVTTMDDVGSFLDVGVTS